MQKNWIILYSFYLYRVKHVRKIYISLWGLLWNDFLILYNGYNGHLWFWGMLGDQETYHAKKLDYTIAILFTQGKTFAENINVSLRFALQWFYNTLQWVKWTFMNLGYARGPKKPTMQKNLIVKIVRIRAILRCTCGFRLT